MPNEAHSSLPEAPPEAWTVAVYLAGGENVSREMIPALHDLRDASLAHGPALRVLAQFEPDRKSPRLFAFDEALRRRLDGAEDLRCPEPEAGGLKGYEYVLERKPLEPGLESPQRLREFVRLALAAAAGRRLMLVISGHGSGAVGEFLGHRHGAEPLHLKDLADVLSPASGRKLDIIGMDCCNMSMVEVAYEIAPYGRFLVASEGYILNHGWPYRCVLDAMVGLPPEQAGEEIVRQYVGTYSDYSLLEVPSHCAVCDLESVSLLSGPMRRLSELLLARIPDPDVWRPAVLAHWEAQSYKDEEYVDLVDFCDRLRTHVGDVEIQASCSAVIDAVGRVVRASHFSGSAFQFSTGLSIYFPWCNDAAKASGANEASELASYRELAFSRETSWGEFLDAYLWVTRREPRPAQTGSRTDLLDAGERTSPQESRTEEQEVRMHVPIKRNPPWNSKGPERGGGVKNHPRNEAPLPGPMPIRRNPPWNSKGPVDGPSRVKNHPCKDEAR